MDIPDNIWQNTSLTIDERLVMGVLASNKNKAFTLQELADATTLNKVRIARAAKNLYFEHLMVYRSRALLACNSIVLTYQYREVK